MSAELMQLATFLVPVALGYLIRHFHVPVSSDLVARVSAVEDGLNKVLSTQAPAAPSK